MLLSLVLPAACGESGDDPAPSGGHPGQPETPGGNEGGDPGETSLKIGITVGSRTITEMCIRDRQEPGRKSTRGES